MKEQKEVEKAIKERWAEVALMDSVLSENYDRSNYTKARIKKKQEELGEELQEAPATVIASQGRELAEAVYEIASKSGKLNGVFMKRLQDASIFLSVGMDKMANRLLTDEAIRETERLREEVAQLRREKEETKGLEKENILLRREVEEMRENPPPHSARKRAPPPIHSDDNVTEMGEENNSPPPSPIVICRSEAREVCRP